ncbi:hypothetical protein A4A49_62517, partial [Nicotiana attenuata]
MDIDSVHPAQVNGEAVPGTGILLQDPCNELRPECNAIEPVLTAGTESLMVKTGDGKQELSTPHSSEKILQNTTAGSLIPSAMNVESAPHEIAVGVGCFDEETTNEKAANDANSEEIPCDEVRVECSAPDQGQSTGTDVDAIWQKIADGTYQISTPQCSQDNKENCGAVSSKIPPMDIESLKDAQNKKCSDQGGPSGADVMKGLICNEEIANCGPDETDLTAGRFPYAVQVWFYECFGYLDSYVACRRENISPPILRWSVTRQLKFEELNDKLYGLPSEKLNLRNMSLENKIEDNVDQIHVTSDDDFVDRPPETLKRQCKMMINENAKRKGTPSNVLEKKGKDVNNLKKQRKDVNETSKMKSIGANDLEKQMMDNVSNSINVTAANKKSGKVVENIHNQNQGIGEACVDPSTKHSEWYTQFKILQDGQDELRKEVSSLKKEYKEELVVLKNYLDGKFVELFNVINSMKKSTLEHHHNGDVKKDVEGDSERKQDAVNEIKQ